MRAGGLRNAMDAKAARHCLSGLLAVAAIFSLAAVCQAAGRGKGSKPAPNEWKLPMELIGGIPVVELSTSQGKIRMVVDTGSNGTTVENLKDENLVIHLKGLEVPVKVHRTVTPILAHFNSFAGLRHRVHGIIGNDFFNSFDFCTFDFRRNELRLSRRMPVPVETANSEDQDHSEGQSRESAEALQK